MKNSKGVNNNNNNVEIDQNTQKSSGDPRRLVITQIPLKAKQLA